nr:hypothetical protein FVER53263_10067 [Fusarium verticillioides]
MTGDPPVSCSFWIPRIKNLLWPEALQSGSIQKLCGFLNRLVKVEPCSAGVEAEYSVGAVVYGMSGNDIEGFIACESCYELYVAGTAFEGRFCQETLQSPLTTVCHMGYPYTRQSVARFAKFDNWDAFVEGAYERSIQQECTGTAVQADSREWLELRPGVADLFAACKTCYMDFLANEAFANEYISSVPPPGPNHQWSCALSKSSVKWALEAAISRQDHPIFVGAVRTISGLSPCTSAGITGGRWFTLVRECPKFSICEGCYTGAIKSRSLDHYFVEIPLQPEELQTSTLYIPNCLSIQLTGVAIPHAGNIFTASCLWADEDHDEGQKSMIKIMALGNCVREVIRTNSWAAYCEEKENLAGYGRARTLSSKDLTPKTVEILAKYNKTIRGPGSLFAMQFHRDPGHRLDCVLTSLRSLLA